MEMMITLSPGELSILRASYARNREKVREHWGRNTFEEYIELLVMHGLNHANELVA